MNWETQIAEKNNDYLEFPMELDMFPYTKEGLHYAEKNDPTLEKYTIEGRPREYYLYRLVGVLVHSGANLNSGHYYSHIQSRFPGPTFGKWFTFNDTNVSPFNLNELKEQTFGGTRSQHVFHQDTKVFQEVETTVTHSAYMLFYERVRYFSNTFEAVSVDPLVKIENSDHLLAYRLFDPALLIFFVSRCYGSSSFFNSLLPSKNADKALHSNPGNNLLQQRDEDDLAKKKKTFDEGDDRLKKQTRSDKLFQLILDRYLLGDAIVARCINSGTYYPQLSDATRRVWFKKEENASEFLSKVSLDDLYHLLIETPEFRTRIAFSSLLADACRIAPIDSGIRFIETILTPKLLDTALANPENSYWYALRQVIEQHNYLALKAFELGMIVEIFNAALGNESPFYDWERASSKALAPHRPRASNAPPPPPSQPSYIRISWDHAIVAAATSASVAFELRKTFDESSLICVKDMTAWIWCIGKILQPESTEKIVSILLYGRQFGFEDDVNLAYKLAKIASASSHESTPRFFDVVSQLGQESFAIPVNFFLGGNVEGHIGFLRLVVTNRASLFAFGCIALFVERLDDFPQMKAPQVLERWLSNVDAFFREDQLTAGLEPREVNRALGVLEILARLQSRPNSALDTISTTPPANGYYSDDDLDSIKETEENM